MPAFWTTIGRGRPQSQSGPFLTIRAEPVFDSEILIVNPFEELFNILKMWNLEIVHMLVNDGFTFRALPGNVIPGHYAVVKPRRGRDFVAAMSTLILTEGGHNSDLRRLISEDYPRSPLSSQRD